MAMVEQGVLHARRPSKRSLSTAETRDAEAKRRSVGVRRNGSSSYGGTTPSYPVSSLYHSHRDPEASNGSHPSMGQASTSEAEISGAIGEGYPGQYDHFRDYPLTHPHPGVDAGRRNEVEMSFPAPQTKRNRFNLARYQLDDEDIPALPALEPEEKPNRFKTQRERLMLAAGDSEEEQESACSVDRSVSSDSQSQSRSQDGYMSQRERLRRFSSEQSRHVVIPNEWEGEQRLQEFVTFGNIEAALRPLGLMMARAALVSDSVTTRQRRSSSAGPSRCHTSLSNPRTS